MAAPLDPRLAQLPPAERRVVEVALQRGYLNPASLEQAFQRAAQGGARGSFLSVLGQGFLTAEQAQELAALYHGLRATPSGRLQRVTGQLQRVTGRLANSQASLQPPGQDSETIAAPPGSAPSQTPRRGGTTGRLGALETPEQVGPYRLIKELARGGMGMVFLAEHEGLGRKVALKLLLPGATDGGEERFLIEAQAAARLRHPHIVGIHDVGFADRRHYLAMDLVEGGSLRERLVRDGPFDPVDAAALMEKVCQGVYYAHTRSILHRDIKPHNVLLSAEGEPLLGDFGLAKVVNEEEGKGLTVTGQVMGTPAYMPPEQAEGQLDRIDRRSDVYSLGATLYELLTGEPPFKGASPMNTVMKVLTEDPRPPSKLRPGLPRDLEVVCLKCLEKEPEQRYDSALALAEDLGRFARGESIHARPVGVAERLVRRAQRNRAIAGSILGGGLLVLALLTVAWRSSESARGVAETARSEAEAERERALRAEDEALAQRDRAHKAESAAEAARVSAEEEGALERTRAELERGYGLLALRRYRAAARAFVDAYRRARAIGGASEEPARRERVARLLGAAERGAREAVSNGGHHTLDHRRDVSFRLHQFAPSGRALLTAPGSEGGVELRDVGALERGPRGRFPVATHGACAFTPDGLAVAIPEREQVRLWELDTQRPLRAFPRRDPCSLAFSADGRLLAIGAQDGAVALFAVGSGELLRTLPSEARPGAAYNTAPECLAFAADAASLLVGYADGLLCTWSLSDPDAPPKVNLNGGGRLAFAALAPPGLSWARWITGGQRGRLRVWQNRRAFLELSHGEAGEITSGALSPRGDRIAGGFEDGSVKVWDVSGRRLLRARGHTRRVHTCSFSPDARLLATGAGDSARLWDLGRARFLPGRGPVALGPRGRAAWQRKSRGGIEVHDPAWAEPRVIPQPKDWRVRIRALAFTRDGDRLIVTTGPFQHELNVSHPHRIELWDLDTLERLDTREQRLGGPLCVTPTGELLVGSEVNVHDPASGREDHGWVTVRELPAGRVTRTLRWHIADVTALAASSEGASYASASLDGSVALWAAGFTGERPRLVLVPRRGVEQPLPPVEPGARKRPGNDDRFRWGVRACDFSPDGTRIITATGDGVARVFDAKSGALQEELAGHAHELRFCAFVDDARVVTVGREAVKVWDLGRPGAARVLRDLKADGSLITHCALSPDRLSLAAASESTTQIQVPGVWVWDLRLPELVGFADDPAAAIRARVGW